MTRVATYSTVCSVLVSVAATTLMLLYRSEPEPDRAPDPDREFWRVTVGGGKPPRIQLVSRDRSDPEPRLRAMVADLVVEVCSKVPEPPVCVDEIVAEGLARLGKP